MFSRNFSKKEFSEEFEIEGDSGAGWGLGGGGGGRLVWGDVVIVGAEVRRDDPGTFLTFIWFGDG